MSFIESCVTGLLFNHLYLPMATIIPKIKKGRYKIEREREREKERILLAYRNYTEH